MSDYSMRTPILYVFTLSALLLAAAFPPLSAAQLTLKDAGVQLEFDHAGDRLRLLQNPHRPRRPPNRLRRLQNLYQPRRPRFQNLLLRPRPPRRLLRLPWLLSRFRCPFRCRGSSGLGRDRRSGHGAAITVAEAGVTAVTRAAASAAAADLALATVFNLRLQTVT